ncbi:MAG: shikimate dehydrogenase [Demequinaceae bacterium]|nr:shikimate dehydrogenase [Demequinaceae bacterium]
MGGERRAGVLGHPIAHSLSPVLHRAAYRALGLAWTYDAYDVTEGELEAFLGRLDRGWAGLSLTMPLKVEAARHMDAIETLAETLEVINTVIVRPEGEGVRLEGANTDVYGVRAALAEAGIEEADSVVILGSGATATSAMTALLGLGCESPVVVARSREETEGLMEAASRLGVAPTIVFTPDAPEVMADARIVVSTIPVEVGATIGASLFPARPGAVLLDAVYDPPVTPLADAWVGVGGRFVPGTRMLLHQAAEQIRLMTGLSAPLEAMDVALVSHLSP